MLLVAVASLVVATCRGGETSARKGDEIIVAGRLVHTGTRVVTWLDADGYDAYANVHRTRAARESPRPADPKNFGVRNTPDEKPVPLGDFDALAGVIDQIVIHYDDSGLSRLCFDTLTRRQLSAHFLVDLDGTVYQTLDVQERAYHATIANSRSIGIEIAGIGALEASEMGRMEFWYHKDSRGRIRIVPPKKAGPMGQLTRHFIARPARPGIVRGVINGKHLEQYDFTAEQYAAVGKLVAALCRTFPRIEHKFPRGASGAIATTKLSEKEFENFHGILGHEHIQENKVDPGPAFQWDLILPR